MTAPVDTTNPAYRAPMIHELKCWPAYFHALADGRKTFELRRDDRPFRSGDVLHIKEWCPTREAYTGRALDFVVSYALRKCPEFGLQDGFVILGIIPAEVAAQVAAARVEERDAIGRALLASFNPICHLLSRSEILDKIERALSARGNR